MAKAVTATSDGKLKNDKVKDVTVAHVENAQITLPIINGKPMSYEDAIVWMQRKMKEEDSVVAVYHQIPCSPLDGLVAFQRVLKERYGWSMGVTHQTFFGPQPPVMVGVCTGPQETDREQVMYGSVRVPGIEGEFETDVSHDPPAFILSGKVKKKYEPQVKELVILIEKKLREGSIYKGQAVRVDFSWDRADDNGRKRGYDIMNDAPQFINPDPTLEHSLVFGEKVDHALVNGLFAPIEFSEACRKNGVPLRRGILLAGPYGTGKTLTASVTATKAVRNGWTFIYLEDVRDLKRGLEFAAQYSPAVLFAEDVDRVVTGPRVAEIDEILNTLDGVNTKNGEIIAVFTTNHADQINEAMLRPGRIDVFVEVTPPDAKAAERLVTLYSRGLLEEGADLSEIGRKLDGKIPAIIREVVERAKIAAIYRLKSANIEGFVTVEDILAAVNAMENHNELIFGKKEAKLDDSPEILVRIPRKSKHGRAILQKFVKKGST